jgi:hypothetical protein
MQIKSSDEQGLLLESEFGFYLPHMEYEGSIGLVTGKMKVFYC